MATTTSTTLQLSITSKSKASFASGQTADFDIRPVTVTCEVPVTRSEAGGIKERIRQVNENIQNPPSQWSESEPAKLAGKGITAQSMYVPNPEEYDETYIFANVDRISAAKMVIVETENIYDYRNA